MDPTHNRSADSTISEFLGVVAHRIHTPVAVIKWQVEGLLDGVLGELTPEQKESLQTVIQSAENLNDFSRTMLAVYELEKDIPMVQPQELVLKDLMVQMEKSLNALLHARNGRIVMPEDAAAASFVADPDIALMILRTFLENAFQYSDPGAEALVTVRQEEGGTMITVEDHGMGIASECWPTIGTKFYRDAEARRRLPDGVGLNLYISKNLAERTGGAITFESEQGRGSKFHWLVPRGGRRRQPWER